MPIDNVDLNDGHQHTVTGPIGTWGTVVAPATTGVVWTGNYYDQRRQKALEIAIQYYSSEAAEETATPNRLLKTARKIEKYLLDGTVPSDPPATVATDIET